MSEDVLPTRRLIWGVWAARTSVLGKVGNDLFGEFVLQDLKRLGIDTSFIRRSQTHPTSCTFIVNVRGQDRRYIHCFGANADFSIADIDAKVLDGARALYVGGYLAMPAFRPEHLVELFREAKQRGLITALDVVIPAGSPSPLEDIRQALPYTDLFLPNQRRGPRLDGLQLTRSSRQKCWPASILTEPS